MAFIEYILLIIYLSLFLVFLYKLFIRIKSYNTNIDFIKLIQHEFREAVRGGVGYMHFSIAAGVVASVALALLHFWKSAMWILWLLLIPIMAGLAWAALYRVEVLARSLNIHKRLGEGSEFRRESTKMQIVLLSIIVMTLLDIFLSVFNYAASLAIGTVRNFLLAQFYVRPAANLLTNFDRGVAEFKTPFMLEDVLSGKVEVEKVKFGYLKIGDVDKDVLLSCESCGEIGACDSVCPAVAAGRLLSPRVVVRTVALNAKNNDYSLAGLETHAWACTTCGACMYECPVKVRHLDVIYGVRRAVVAEGRMDKKIGDVLLSASQFGNTMSTPNVDRHKWLLEMGVKHISEGAEYLLWVGCMGSFDGRSREIVKAFVEILRTAGMLDKVGVLGDEETCCGDPIRRLGEESRFQEIVLQNRDLFNRYGVKKVITICPHGYNVFKNEYPKFGVELEVYHHSEIIQKLAAEGRIDIKGGGVYTIHDPCYLARYNRVVKPQRDVVVKLGQLREPRRRGEKTFCCGAGGGNYWYDVPEEKRISHIRLEELVATGASTIVTLCPFCNAMLSDAARTKEIKIEIKDLAELTLAAIRRNSHTSQPLHDSHSSL
ncbi:MAG: (Fe-S)-binding protein [Pyrobaculum sp.]